MDMTDKTAEPDLIPPLVFTVAITGHRAIPDEQRDALRAAIADLLKVAKGAVTDSAIEWPDAERERQFRFVSALAEGADRIAWDAASADPAWQREAVLPFAREDYAQTFDDPARIAVVDQAIAAGVPVLQLADWRWQATGEDGAPDNAFDQMWQARRYRTLGQILVRRADLLIAVWRGKPAAGVGGTADVVAETGAEGVPTIWIDPDDLRIRSIVPQPGTSRRQMIDDASDLTSDGAARAIEAAAHSVMLGGNDASAEAIRRFSSRERVREWRIGKRQVEPGTTSVLYASTIGLLSRGTYKPQVRLLRKPATRNRSLAARVKNWLTLPSLFVLSMPDWPDDKYSAAPAPVEDAPRGNTSREAIVAATASDAAIAPYFGFADKVGTRLGHLYRSSYIAIFSLSAMAIFIAALSLIFRNWTLIAAIGELATLSIALFIWMRVSEKTAPLRGLAVHRRWLDARFVAEMLRGAKALSWIGFSGRSSAPSWGDADESDRSEHAWSPRFANAVSTLPHVPNERLAPDRLATIGTALKGVVVGQKDYHAKNAERLQNVHKSLDKLGQRFIALSIIFVLALVVLYGLSYIPRFPFISERVLSVAGIVAAFFGSVSPAIAAAAAGIRYHGDYERFARRSLETRSQLLELERKIDVLIARSDLCGNGACSAAPPLYEELLEITQETANLLSEDLRDWRFSYAVRPVPTL